MSQDSWSESDITSNQGSAPAVNGTAPNPNQDPAQSEWNFNTIMAVLISLRFLLVILIDNPPPNSLDPDDYTNWLINVIGLALNYVRKNSRPHFDAFDRTYQRWMDEPERPG